MKKVFLIFIMILTFLGVVACNNNQSEIDFSYDEQIESPTKLAIDEKVLSWDAVADAASYDVYVDGEKVGNVKTNSYDFSDLTESRIIFTVVTVAPRGMVNSQQSISIAYVENKEAEIASMKLAVELYNEMPFSDDFAEELVNKGMLASEFEDMMNALLTFKGTVKNFNNVNDAYLGIETMMDSVDNVEALISALIKTVLPDLIAQEIAYLEQSVYGNSEEIAMLEEFLTILEDSEEEVIKTILIVFEYIVSIEEMVNQELITKINNLSNTDEFESLNVNELVLIKDEIVDVLKETMPSQSEVVLVVNTLNTLASLLQTSQDIEAASVVYPEKMAATMLMTFEASLRFVDNYDLAFFTELKTIGTSTDSDYTKQAKIVNLSLNYVDQYFDENEDLLDQIEGVYTDEEKEVMYNDYLNMVEEILKDEANLEITISTIFSFDKMMNLRIIFEDAFEELLDAYVASNGEIFLLIAEMRQYELDFDSPDNHYKDYYEYDYNLKVYQFKIANELVTLLNSVISERSLAEFEEVRGFLVDATKLVLETGMAVEYNDDTEELIVAVEAFLTNTTEEEYELIQSVFKFLDEEDVLLDYITAYQNVIGEDYDLVYSDDNDYFTMAFVYSVYDDYMTTTVRENIDNVLDELAVLFSVSVFDEFNLGIYPELIEDGLDYIDSVSSEVAGFDYSNLTEANLTRLHEIEDALSDLMEQKP